ncbi:hypothetical protein DL769_005085 [Monosporascus sp. CRB-8-3]|nr:hypothetical protein DL769_005085 [Monosporascus sp. CRB-8-3]
MPRGVVRVPQLTNRVEVPIRSRPSRNPDLFVDVLMLTQRRDRERDAHIPPNPGARLGGPRGRPAPRDARAGQRLDRGTQLLLKDMRANPDFEFAARNHLDDQQYSFYRTAAMGKWRKTTILGYNFSAYLHRPGRLRRLRARAQRAEPREATGEEDTPYCAAMYAASKTIESNSILNGPQALFQQLNVSRVSGADLIF